MARILRRNNVRGVLLGLGMRGRQYQFWSPAQAVKAEFVCYDFMRPGKGFIRGFDRELLGVRPRR